MTRHTTDARLENVCAVLRSDPVRRITFSYDGWPFSGSDYFHLSRLIERGAVAVEFNVTDLQYAAQYSFVRQATPTRTWEADTIYFGPGFSFERITSRALLVHEVTHAIQDGHALFRDYPVCQRVTWEAIDVEACAYVAHAMYFFLCGTTWEHEQNPQTETGRALVRAADGIAARLCGGATPLAVEEHEKRRLHVAIGNRPEYRRLRRSRRLFDGLGGEPDERCPAL